MFLPVLFLIIYVLVEYVYIPEIKERKEEKEATKKQNNQGILIIK